MQQPGCKSTADQAIIGYKFSAKSFENWCHIDPSGQRIRKVRPQMSGISTH